MLMRVSLFIIGLVCLIKGGDWSVDGATGIARKSHLSELLIGTIAVSIGTTLPGVMVSTTSALTDHSRIAHGNAVGSVICNTALIATITAAIKPGEINRKTLRTSVLFFSIAAVIYTGVTYFLGYFSRTIGFILLEIFVVYMVTTVSQMKNSPPAEIGREKEGRSLGINLVPLVIGAALIAVGVNLLVTNETLIVEALGAPEFVIALTLVALGTSLPELVMTITSLVKGHGALSLGDVIGVNLFNLILVSGVSVSLAPFSIPQSSILLGQDASLMLGIPIMLTAMLLLTVPVLARSRLSRVQGILLPVLYFAFCGIRFTL